MEDEMKLVDSDDKYDYYIGEAEGRLVYNIVTKGSDVPSAGFYNKTFIEKIKGVSFKGDEK